MLLLTHFTEDQWRLMLLDYSLAPYTHFHCAYGFFTRKLACLIDSLVRVQDGCKKAVSTESHKPLRPTSVKRCSLRRTWKKTPYSTVVNLILSSVGRGSSSATTSGPFEETIRLCFRKSITHIGQLPYLPSQRFQVF